jgi:superfamily II DNA helicase RecQ
MNIIGCLGGDQRAIIYCVTIRDLEKLKVGRLSEISSFYHGEMNRSQKKLNFDLWINGSKRIMIATKAFGLGILEGLRWVGKGFFTLQLACSPCYKTKKFPFIKLGNK